MFNENQLSLLNQELDSSRIKSRSKGNINLSYLEGFDIIDSANRIFGYGNWDYSISNLETVSQELNHNQNHIICYKAVVKIKVYDETHTSYISREDVGFGTGISKTLADSNEGAAKEAVTDAIKRTLRSFGNQFGNSLYDKSKNHNNQTYQNQSYNKNSYQPSQNANSQNYQSTQTPYQHNQDFSQLTNIGLTVMQQGDNLVVVGDGIFEKKDTIRQNGFRWDGVNKIWYMPLRVAA